MMQSRSQEELEKYLSAMIRRRENRAVVISSESCAVWSEDLVSEVVTPEGKLQDHRVTQTKKGFFPAIQE